MFSAIFFQFLLLLLTNLSIGTTANNELSRIDCYPESYGGVDVADEEKCVDRGCIWSPSEIDAVPWCHVPQPEDPVPFGYTVVGGPEPTSLGDRWYLQRLNQFAIYGDNIEYLTFDVEYRDDNILRFKFDDANSTERFKVPVPVTLGEVRADNPVYTVQVLPNETFAFRVLRTDTGTVVWDSSVGGFAFTDQFLQISTRLPSANVYGLGENLHKSLRHDLNFVTWPLWARDQPPQSGDDSIHLNLYSVHPFYECVEEDGNTHGVFFFNANAMDYTLSPFPMLTYKTIGGILDFMIFFGPTPDNVVQQYTQVVGRPYMPPYWMLGFQLSRYGYTDTNAIREAVERTKQYDIPHDVQYVDIDHMYKQRDFSLDQGAFGDLPQYFSQIRQQGIKTVIILDPALEINDTYRPYVEGREEDIYIQWPDRDSMPEGDYEEYNRTDMMGYVWPEWKVVFPDYFLNETEELWTEWLVDFRREVIEFDALWLDMNEPANFDTNNWRPWNWPADDPRNWTLKCPETIWDDPPYRTKAAYMYDVPSEDKEERLSGKTLCLVGTHERGVSRHYDLHNLYGWKQTEVSLRSVRAAVRRVTGNTDLRSMVVSRSTYSGSGQHAGRWLGDNASTWKDLFLSVIGLLEFNIMGFPYVGADICGFFNDCPARLCTRWQEVGAFYPYARNHNNIGTQPQDPGYYGQEVADRSRETLLIRYRLLPYLYTLFHRANTLGTTVVKPLFQEYPADSNTWTIERQFLWGPALLVTPILDENPTELTYYIPRGRWYDWYTFDLHAVTEGEFRTIPVNDDTRIKLLLRGGYVLPWQQPANNTQSSRVNPFGLLVALDAEDGRAEGELFWDDGDSTDTFERGNYYFATYLAEGNFLNLYVEHNEIEDEMSELTLDTVQILGALGVSAVFINGSLHSDFEYDETKQYLELYNLQLDMNENYEIFWSSSEVVSIEENERIDCCPEQCDETMCASKQCQWKPTNVTGVPPCHIINELYGYHGNFQGEDGRNYSEWKDASSMFGGDMKEITFTKTQHGHIFRFKVEDYNDLSRYQVPLPLNIPPETSDNVFKEEYQYEPTFTFKLSRSDQTTVLFDTSLGGVTMSNQFLQITTRLATTNVYGFGEHVHSKLKHQFHGHSAYPMFARDEPPKSGANLYSSHPFYMVVEDSGKAHGVLFWNSNAMEVVFQPAPALTIRTVGGIIDIFVIVADGPEELIQRYHQLIGLPYLPPYWSLGFQISRYGYDTLDNMKAAVDRTRAANIPLDVVHMDIDSFEEYKSFTWDKRRFAGLPEYLGEVHDMKIKAVLLVDPFLISNESSYMPYDLGLERDVFVKWPVGLSPDRDIHNNDNLLGWAWPLGRTVFPDYFHENSTEYWEDVILAYHQHIPFDGLWLDMNEPANFGTNEEKPWNWPDEPGEALWSLKCPDNSVWDNPTYKPKSIYGEWLCDKTICMTAIHKSGSLRHYDVHSLYGHSQTLPTLSGLRKAVPGKRGLVITRSTFPGTGSYGGRWLGDNAAIWPHLKDSIIGMMEFNLFGIPYVGADICGYFDSCPETLCQRWQQLGAFYPFSRNHNGLGYDDQDPGVYSESMQASTRAALSVRYQLLPYLYTLFYHVHTTGGTVVRPLFHEFPTDVRALNTDEHFLWGPALLISPVLRQHEVTVVAYFPDCRWFDYYTGKEVAETGRSHKLDAPMNYIPVHVRGGYILTTQQPANTTYHSRVNPFQLLVVPDSNNQSTGDLFWDDGESIDTVETGNYCLNSFVYHDNHIEMSIEHQGSTDLASAILDQIRVLGVNSRPSSISSEGATFTYNPQTKVLMITDLLLPMDKVFSVSWTF